MCAAFVNRFTDNENGTSITYGRYSRASSDKYPTFSICFRGDRLHWYNKQSIYGSFELNHLEYQKMLRGEKAFKYEYEPSSRLYRKTVTHVNNGSDADFEPDLDLYWAHFLANPKVYH